MAACMAVLSSCQKEVGFGDEERSGSAEITGDWTFVGLDVHTHSVIETTDGPDHMRNITTSDYKAINPVGTVKITANQFITQNIGYSINSTAHLVSYLNGTLLLEQDFPMNIDMPPSSSTANYTRNSNDSLTFTTTVSSLPDPTGGAFSGPMGTKISWSGDTLLLKMSVNATYDAALDPSVPLPGTITDQAVSTMKLKRL